MPGAKADDSVKTDIPSSSIYDPTAVREALAHILESRHFRHSRQGSRFLQYIVEETLRGNAGLLKERILGTALFGRIPDYATGDDPIVRVQANDVRRRLEAYAAEHLGQSSIVIELPAGSYVPLIRAAEMSESLPAVPTPFLHRRGNGTGVLPQGDQTLFTSDSAGPRPSRRGRAVSIAGALIVLAAVCAAVFGWRSRQASAAAPEQLANEFWQPLLSSPNPVVISIGKVVVYRPSAALFGRFARQHPGTFNSSIDRLTRPLPLKPGESVKWGDLDEADNQGFSMGSMRSAMNLAGFLAQHHKPFTARLGVESSFAELRNAPAVMIGAFNNRWTMDLTAGLHFTFTETDGRSFIREESAGREWERQFGPAQQVTRDYGLVTRLLAWKTGQAAISAAGLGHEGTTAATEMITNPAELAEVLKSLPMGWEQKNVQLVISADSTDNEAGRPTLVAYYLW